MTRHIKENEQGKEAEVVRLRTPRLGIRDKCYSFISEVAQCSSSAYFYRADPSAGCLLL
jgi:hypothetical protein